MPLRTFVIALFLTIAACATTVPPAERPNIYVMRHLHTPEGVRDPDLTEEGRAHAIALDNWFRRDPPAVIYVSDTSRSRQTAEPLARRLRLTPKIYDPRDTPGLVGAVLAEPGTVLVVGHSNTVPDIIEQLGGTRPRALVHHDFADIWRVHGPRRTTDHVRLTAGPT